MHREADRTSGLVLWLAVFAAVSVPHQAQAFGADASILEVAQEGLERFVAGDRAGAYPLLERAAVGRTENAHVYLFKGAHEREQGRTKRALDTFERGTGIAPKPGPLGLELAPTRSWLGDLEGALDAYDRALSLEPMHTGAHLGRARVLAWLGNHDEALSLYHDVLSREPRNTEAINGIAFVDRADRRYGDAERRYLHVLQLEPENEEAKEGLEAAREATRNRLTTLAGLAHIHGAQTDAVGEAELSHEVNARLRLSAGYGLTGVTVMRDADLAGQRANTTVHRASAGLGYQIGEAHHLSTGYQAAVRPDRVDHAGEAGYALQLSEALSTQLGVRLYFTAPVASLASAGLQWTYRPDSFVMLQGFRFSDHKLHSGTTAALTLRHQWNGAVGTKLVGAFGFHTQTGYQGTVLAEVQLRASRNNAFFGRYEYFGAIFARSQVLAGVEHAF